MLLRSCRSKNWSDIEDHLPRRAQVNFNSNLQVRDHENSAFCAGAGWVLSGEWGWTCKGSQRILKQLKVCNCPYKRLRSLWSTCHGPWGTRALKVLKLKLRFKSPSVSILGPLPLMCRCQMYLIWNCLGSCGTFAYVRIALVQYEGRMTIYLWCCSWCCFKRLARSFPHRNANLELFSFLSLLIDR